MKHVNGYVCTICNKVYGREFKGMTCTECGEKGILDVLYDYGVMKKVVNRDYFKKKLPQNIWRYKPLLPIEASEEILKKSLSVGCTPLYEASESLDKEIGIRKLYIKDDGVNPTGSLKDRASIVGIIKAIEMKKDIIACSSTGNAASSLAGNAARYGLKSVIFVPKRAPVGKVAQLLIYGAKVVMVDGDYKAAFNLSKAAIDEFGWYNRNAAINPYLIEGKKTVALEIGEQLGFQMPDWIAVSVGDGCTIGGVYKGLFDLYQLGLIQKIPRILGVQATGCSPFYDAFINNESLKEVEENTIADSISVGIPRNPVKGMNAVLKTKGAFVAVTDEEILKGMKLMGRHEGVFGEPAASAGIAGVKKARVLNIIKSDESVVTINTGNGLKDTKNAMRAAGDVPLQKPDFEAFRKQVIEGNL